MATARGAFDVEMIPEADDEHVEATSLGRFVVKKRFHGDLEGTSEGRMLTGMTPVTGSAGYVLIERFRGRLRGEPGSFLLQHFGVLDRGTPRQTVEVIPDSGTDALSGLTGRMRSRSVEEPHAFEFEYVLPSPR